MISGRTSRSKGGGGTIGRLRKKGYGSAVLDGKEPLTGHASRSAAYASERDNVEADSHREQKDRPRPLLTTTGRNSGMWPRSVGASSDTPDEVSFHSPDI